MCRKEGRKAGYGLCRLSPNNSGKLKCVNYLSVCDVAMSLFFDVQIFTVTVSEEQQNILCS
jgi:hypothetical protein